MECEQNTAFALPISVCLIFALPVMEQRMLFKNKNKRQLEKLLFDKVELEIVDFFFKILFK